MSKQVYSWDEVTDDQIAAFHIAIERLKSCMLPKDCDGHFPVQVLVVDRRRYGPMHWQPVPYDHREPDKHFAMVLHNLALATASMDLALRLRKYLQEDKSDASQGNR